MSNQGSSPKKIHFEVGIKLEAQDFTQNWYPARICRVDNSGRKSLIHFEGWNHRFDEWISFDSERLRHSSRMAESKEDKGDKASHSPEWKVGDRALAKWSDGKFYPAKITKKNEDGVFEVLFYDGVKKYIQRMNLKPDNRKTQALPVSKDRLSQQSAKTQRKTLLANARAERARKRSKELGEGSSSMVLGKKREKHKKQRLDSDSVSNTESSAPSPAETPDDTQKTDILSVDDDIKNISGTSSCITEDTDVKALDSSMDTSTESTESTQDNKAVEGDMNMKEDETKSEQSTEKEVVESKHLETNVSEVEKESISADQVEKSPAENTCSIEKTTLEPCQEINTEKNIEPTEEPATLKDLLDSTSKNTSCLNADSIVASTSDTVVLSKEIASKDSDSVLEKSSPDVSEKKADEIVEQKENTDNVNQENVLNDQEMTDKPQESQLNDSPKSSVVITTDQQLENNNITNIVQAIEEPKPTDNKTTTKKPTKISPKNQKKAKGIQNNTGEKKRPTRSRSAISPRGYGYSMAVMHPQVSKPESNSAQTPPSSNQTTESIDTIIDSLSKDTAVVENMNALELDASENTQDANNEVPQTKVKRKNFQAKKFRLDQITVKLSAQRQSEAEAAVQSPSAFQMTMQQSSSPPLLPTPPPAVLPTPPPQKAPSPSAPLTSHYTMDNYNVPPPLIYAPMAAQCCSNPLCQQHAGVYPAPPRAQLHSGMSHPMHLPSHLHPHSAGYVMYPPGHVPTYDTRPPIAACSCAGCTGQLYHHMPPEAGPHHESALARLMQVEQRILHAGPSPHMAHYRDSTPRPGPWLPHGHPQANQYCPLPTKHEEMWRHERPPHQPKSPSHISPVPETEAAKIIRRWQNERSFHSASSSSTDVIPGRIDELLTQGQSSVHSEPIQREPPSFISRESKDLTEKILFKENVKNNLEVEKDKPQPITTTHPKPCESSIDEPMNFSTASNMFTTAVSTPLYSQATSLGGRPRKGKEPVGLAPKELIIDLDHNKYKCPVKGCDKSFRKESGLDYHMKYYHSPGGKEGKRKRSSASMRSDGTPESSPDIPGPSLTKRRCHRSSAPGQLSCEPIPGIPIPGIPIPGIPPPTSIEIPSKQDTTLEPTPQSLVVKEESPAKPTATQEVELEIEPGTETDVIYCGSIESVEVEEEDVLSGDVIRCRCEETEEGGFMIQCEQCLTWQHSECVGLTEQTVPSKYLCYVCSNPKGLRRRAKYRNDFDWFRKGSLPKFSFMSKTEDNQEYNNQLSLSTHDLMSDVHSIDNVLKSLRVKLDILRSPNHPALGMWYEPVQKNELTDLSLKSPDTLDTIKPSIETSLLMVKSESFSNGLQGPKSTLTDHNQNGIETTLSNGSSGLYNGEVTSDCPREVPTQQELLNLTVDSSVNTQGTEDEAISPLPPLVPVGGTVRREDTDVPDPKNMTEKTLNNNTVTQEQSLSKNTGVSVLVADDDTIHSTHSKSQRSSGDTNTENIKNDDDDSFDSSETKDQVATSNLLLDVSELQDSLDARMDIVERQIEVLEQTQDNCDQFDTTKPDLRKLAKDLNRIKRLALHVG